MSKNEVQYIYYLCLANINQNEIEVDFISKYNEQQQKIV